MSTTCTRPNENRRRSFLSASGETPTTNQVIVREPETTRDLWLTRRSSNFASRASVTTKILLISKIVSRLFATIWAYFCKRISTVSTIHGAPSWSRALAKYLAQNRTGAAHHIFEFVGHAQVPQRARRIRYLAWSTHQSFVARELGRKEATP